MSRILLLVIFMLWMAGTPSKNLAVLDSSPGLVVFFTGFALLVLVMGLWGRTLARRVAAGTLHRDLRRFNRAMSIARAMIPAWFAVGLAFGWRKLVETAIGTSEQLHGAELPGALVGTFPAFVAWMGLWWSQYPADRALREQSLLIQLDDNLPLYAPPGFWSYIGANLRLQLLFMIVPVLSIMLLRDIAALICYWKTGHRPSEGLELMVGIGSGAVIFILAPMILKRVLHTQRLPDSPLRRRLDDLCRKNNLRYRDILLWHTQNNLGNAAVMGVLPGLRYVLLSDLLLDTMTDKQIEAVFAHELGHIVYRHMIWYVVFIVILMLGTLGPGDLIYKSLAGWILPKNSPALSNWEWGFDAVMVGAGVGIFFFLFGFLSRRFERQADVFAARMMERENETPDSATPQTALATVGSYGASLFASALHRVAIVNNVPVTAPSWCHGSIAKRMDYLDGLSRDAEKTERFDQTMGRVYLFLVTALFACGAWVAVAAARGDITPGDDPLQKDTAATIDTQTVKADPIDPLTRIGR